MPNAFENMPDVGKKKMAASSGKPNRTPLILGAVGGCLLLLLCATLGLGGFLYWSSTQAKNPGSSAPAASNTTSSAGVAPLGNAPSSSSKTFRIAASVDRGNPAERRDIWILNSDGSDPKQVLNEASSPVFSPDGSQIAYYHWTDGIYVVNSDGTNPRKILGETNAKYLAWSHDGKWIAFSSQTSQRDNAPVNIDAIRVDGSGRRTIVFGGMEPTWSPDDSQIAFSSCRGSDCGIFKASSAGGDAGTLVIGGLGSSPAWSPNGKQIVYQADADGVKQLFVVNVDGTGKKQMTSGTNPHVGAQWSPDGSTIFYRAPESGNWGIWKMNADGSNPTRIANDYPPVDWAYERLALGK